MSSKIGKKEFYCKAKEALTSEGYEYFDGDKDIRGKGRSHAKKPDYIAIKGNVLVIGEIKSPSEGPLSSSWRQIQPGDSKEFSKVRTDVREKEKKGVLPKEIGGHEIIIRGQICDYVKMIGKTYDPPSGVCTLWKKLMGGYTVHEKESSNVVKALSNCQKSVFEAINIQNESVTYIFKL